MGEGDLDELSALGLEAREGLFAGGAGPLVELRREVLFGDADLEPGERALAGGRGGGRSEREGGGVEGVVSTDDAHAEGEVARARGEGADLVEGGAEGDEAVA